MNINKIICTGRLTKDPELRRVSEEMKSLPAASGGRRDGPWSGGRLHQRECLRQGRRGLPPSTLAKGWLVAVDGRLEYGEWETDGGEKRHDYYGRRERRVPDRPRNRPRSPRPPSRPVQGRRGSRPSPQSGPHPSWGCGLPAV